MGNYFRSNNTVDKKLQVGENCDVTLFVSTKNLDSEENSSDGVVVENPDQTPISDTSNSSKLNNLRNSSSIEGENLKEVVDTPESVEPTQPIIEPTQPIIEPTQPIIEPTQPIIEPTQPIVEPTQPIVEPTEHVNTAPEPVPVKKQAIYGQSSQQGGSNVESIVSTDKEVVTKKSKKKNKGAKK